MINALKRTSWELKEVVVSGRRQQTVESGVKVLSQNSDYSQATS